MDNAPDDVLRLVLEACSTLMRESTLQENPYLDIPLIWGLENEASVPLTTRLVSRRFRAITDSTPSLWTTVTEGMPPHLYHQFLSLSNEHGLTIGLGSLVDETNPDQQAFLRAVLRHRHRWQAMFVNLPEGHVCDVRLPQTDDRHFPVLEMVVATGERARGQHDVIALDQNLFMSSWLAPRLESSMLFNAMPRGDAFNGLATLHIIFQGRMVHPKRLWNALAGCHVLHTLHISCDSWIRCTYSEDTANSIQPLVLNSVRTFTLILDQMRRVDCSWLFQVFQFPRLHRFLVTIVFAIDKLTVQQWVAEAFSAGRVGCTETLEYIKFDILGSAATAEPCDLALVDTLFQDKTFASLTHLELGQDLLRVDTAAARSLMEPFAHLPPALALLDISGIVHVSSSAFRQLVDRLCNAGSRAILRVRKQSLFNDALPGQTNEDVFKDMSGMCEDATRKGRMAFMLDWRDFVI